MGASESIAVEPVVAEPPIEPPSPLPPPNLLALPPDAIRLIASNLSLSSLSSLGCVCYDFFTSVAALDDLFGPLLAERVANIGDPRRLHSGEENEAIDFINLLPALERVARDNNGRCREGCSLLRQHLCVLCNLRSPTGIYFTLTRRGVCSACMPRAGHVERFRRTQLQKEQQARRRVDESTRKALQAALADALPPHLCGGSSSGADEDGGGPRFHLLFDSARHGGSSAALLRAADNHSPPCSIVLIQTAGGRRFGSFIDRPWSDRSHYFGGSGCFLFSLGHGPKDPDPYPDPLRTIRPTGLDDKYAFASASVGIGFGGAQGLDGVVGLGLDASLTIGSCRPSLTYGTAAADLMPGYDPEDDEQSFSVASVQLWSVLPPTTDDLSVLRTSKKAPWEEQDEDPGCLEPGENKLMLEFIGMDREIAMLRRFS